MLTGGIRDRATIDALLDAGIDVIGLARPLAVDPAFAGGLLAGDSRGPIATPRRSAVRAIGAALHSPWYQQQIHRLAHGEPADPGQSRVATAYRQAALLRRWARTDTRRRKGSGAASMP
jgi:hypothetical protein